MARTYAPLLVAIWNDADFLALDEGPQRIYFVANSQANMTYCGVVPFMPVSWSTLARNSTAAKIRRDVKALEEAHFVILDKLTEELWIKSFIKHNNVMSQPNIVKAMKASYETIRSATIKQAVYHSVPKDERKDMTNPFGSKPPPKVEPFDEPLPEGVAEGNGKPLDPTQGYGSESLVVSGFDLALDSEPDPSPPPPPAPTTEPEPVTPTALTAHEGPPGSRLEDEIASQKAFNRKVLDLTDRAMDLFGFDARKANATHNVMRTAMVYLDDQLIDECIGYCAGLDDRPQTPAYLRKTLVGWAAQRGIVIPDITRAAS